jgi:hypothetical protein
LQLLKLNKQNTSSILMAAFFRELLLVLALLVCIFADRLPSYSCQSSNDTQWQSATNGATWYGAPDGDGSDGKI